MSNDDSHPSANYWLTAALMASTWVLGRAVELAFRRRRTAMEEYRILLQDATNLWRQSDKDKQTKIDELWGIIRTLEARCVRCEAYYVGLTGKPLPTFIDPDSCEPVAALEAASKIKAEAQQASLLVEKVADKYKEKATSPNADNSKADAQNPTNRG